MAISRCSTIYGLQAYLNRSVRVLSRLFRRRFLEECQNAHRDGRLKFFGEHIDLADADTFADWLPPLRQCEWVVYAKHPFSSGPEAVLAFCRATPIGWQSATRASWPWMIMASPSAGKTSQRQSQARHRHRSRTTTSTVTRASRWSARWPYRQRLPSTPLRVPALRGTDDRHRDVCTCAAHPRASCSHLS
jgi:hypothetical protein